MNGWSVELSSRDEKILVVAVEQTPAGNLQITDEEGRIHEIHAGHANNGLRGLQSGSLITLHIEEGIIEIEMRSPQRLLEDAGQLVFPVHSHESEKD